MAMPRFQDNRFPSQDPPYKDLWQRKWGSYTAVSYHHYRELRDEGRLPKNEMILLFRDPGAMFFRPPAPALSISAVKTVFSVAPDSVGASVNNNDDDEYLIVPKKAVRAAKQQVRAAREALRALDPYVRASAVSSSPADTKIKPHNGFKTPIKSASEPPPPKTTEHTCRKCGNASFRSRNALFDHIYSNTCKPSARERPTSKSSNLQSSIITANNTPVNQTAPASQTALKTSSTWLSRRLASSTTTATKVPVPSTPIAPDSHGLFTPVKTRPVPGTRNESPLPWEFEYKIEKRLPLSPSSSPVTAVKENSQLSTPDGSHGNKLSTPPEWKYDPDPFRKKPSSSTRQPITPDNSHGNEKLASFKQPSTPCSCRTCSKSFASRNLLFAHLHEHNHCRPDKSFKIKNTSWRSGKMIQMDFGVLGDIMSKLAAVASTA